MARKKKEVDWISLEVDYRANVKTMRALAQEYGISTARIGQVAEERSWERDLAAKIAAKTQAKLDRTILDTKLDAETSSIKKATENQVIEANSDLRVAIQLGQRRDISRSRTLVMTLLNELELQTGSIGLLEQLAELLYDKDSDDLTAAQHSAQDKRMELFNKVISLSGRTGTMKSLADSLKTLVTLERESYGLDVKTPTGNSGVTGSVSYIANIPSRA